MTEQFTEYAIRVTLPGYSPRITPYSPFPRDAIRDYDHAVRLQDGGVCDSAPWTRTTTVADGIGNWQS